MVPGFAPAARGEQPRATLAVSRASRL